MAETSMPLENVNAELEAVVSRVQAGETIVITCDGQPVARLSPIPTKRPIVYGDLADLGPLLSGDLSLPQDMLDDFERSLENTARQLEQGKSE